MTRPISGYRTTLRAALLAVTAVVVGAAFVSCDGPPGDRVTGVPDAPSHSTSPTENTSPLEVRIESPSNGATVSGTVTIEVRVRERDGARHDRTEIFIGSDLVLSSTSDRVTYSWNTTGHSGSQTITGVGWDTQGRSAVRSATVTVPGGDDGGGEPPSTPLVSYLTLSPDTIVSGTAATGRVVLDRAAPSGGTAVSVVSNRVHVATVPSSVTVAAGDSAATFPVTGQPVASPDWAAITVTTGTDGSDYRTATLWVLPAGVTLDSLTMSPTVLTSGQTSDGVVRLTGPAPVGGAVVTLWSSDPSRATVSSSVTVPEGQTTASFVATAQPVASSVAANINAEYGGVTRFVRLVISPAQEEGQLSSLTIEPDLVVGGETAVGTVTLGAAGSSSTTVALSSTNTSVATVPSSVTVPAGAASATFEVATLPNNTGTGQFAVIEGTAGGVTRSATITSTGAPSGPSARAMDLFPSQVGGGGPVTGIITFDGSLEDGVMFEFEVSQPDLVQVLNFTLTGPVGDRAVLRFWSPTQRAFAVITSPVGSSVAVTITARACCGAVGQASATLTVTPDAPPPPDVVRVTRARWRPGGTGGELTVRATSTSGTALLTAYIAGTDRLLMPLYPIGDGVYEGVQAFGGGMTNPGEVDVRSNLGGSDTARVR
jgi:hypothetical protein